MRRISWTLGMTLIGLFLALKGQDVDLNPRELIIGGVWGASIGFGFGSIFGQRLPGKKLIAYWAFTLAMLGLFFGPLLPVGSFVVRQAAGGGIGIVAGRVVGVVHLKSVTQKADAPLT